MLEERIYNDYVSAMKAKDKPKSEFLSFLRAQFKNSAIDLRKEKLDDPQALKVLQKQKKRLQDTLASVESSGREDLIAQAKQELALLNAYLPAAMDEQELTRIIEAVIKDSGAASMKDMGRVMKEVMSETAGRADSKQVSDLVKQKLSS